MKELITALVKAQKEFKPALKNSTNPHFRSKYADLDSCLKAVMEALNNHGIALTQYINECEDGVKIETLLMHESGEIWSTGELHLPVSKQDAQGYGSALTYARRYSLMLIGLAPEDDDGNLATKAKPEAKPEPVIKQLIDPWESLDKSTQETLQNVIDSINAHCLQNDIVGAFEEYSTVIDNEEKIAVWSKLGSKIRSALKVQGKLARENINVSV